MSLPTMRDIGKALAYDERLRLLAAAKKQPGWFYARIAATIALNTGMRLGEIRLLQWKHVDFMGRTVTIAKAKTDAGVRVLPLNLDAYAAILEVRERSQTISGTQPEHFLFRVRGFHGARSVTPDDELAHGVARDPTRGGFSVAPIP